MTRSIKALLSTTLVLMLAVAVIQPVGAIGQAPAFTDVQGHWAQAQIEDLAGLGIINGVGNDRFEPNSRLTRAQLVKMLVEALALDLPESYATPTFGDTGGHWARAHIEAAVKAGIIVPGEHGASFEPNRDITRLEIAKMIIRAMGMADAAQAALSSGQLPDFGDIASIPFFDRGYVAVANQAGIITGYPGSAGGKNTFKPDNPASRAEATVMMVRMLRGTGVSGSVTAVQALTTAQGSVVELADYWTLNLSEGHFLMLAKETQGEQADVIIGLNGAQVQLAVTEEDQAAGRVNHIQQSDLSGSAAGQYPQGLYTVALNLGDRPTGYIKTFAGVSAGTLGPALHSLATAYPEHLVEEADYWALSLGKHAIMWAKAKDTVPQFMVVLDAGEFEITNAATDGSVILGNASFFAADEIDVAGSGSHPQGVYVIGVNTR